MATKISDLGNGVGFIYVKENSSGLIFATLPNAAEGVRTIKTLGGQSAPIASGISATGEIEFNSDFTHIGTDGVITGVLVNSISQITTNVTFAASKTKEEMALAVRDQINSDTPASGANYTASVDGGKVIIIAPASEGDNVNGDAVAVTQANANLDVVKNRDMEGGVDPQAVTDEASGYSFFLNSDASAPQGDISGALEITNSIVPKKVDSQTVITIDAFTAASNKWTSTEKRNTAFWLWELDIDATGELHEIAPDEYLVNDQITIYAKDPSRVITFKDKSTPTTGNIILQGAQDFVTGDQSRTITFRLENDPSDGLVWKEVNRNPAPVPTQAEFDAAGYNIGVPGSTDRVFNLAGETIDLEVGVDTEVQRIIGSGALTGDLIIRIKPATNTKKGDRFLIMWDADIDLSGSSVIIFGTSMPATFVSKAGAMLFGFSLTDGGPGTFSVQRFRAQGGLQTIDGAEIANDTITANQIGAGAVGNSELDNGAVDNAKLANNAIDTINIINSAVNADKLSTAASSEIIILPVSFESGEIGTYQMEMNYKCTVLKVISRVSLAIEATDDATIQMESTSGVMASALITHTAAAAFGDEKVVGPTSNNTVDAGEVIKATTAKATVGGKAILVIQVQKIT